MPDSPKPSDAANAARDTFNAGANAARDGAQRASAQFNNMAGRSADLGQQTMNAYVESGKQASQLIGDVNKAMTDAYSKSLADYNELSKQALSCRTVQDVVTLQSNAMQAFQDNLSAMAQINRLFVDGFTRAIQPVASRAEATVDQAAAQTKATFSA